MNHQALRLLAVRDEFELCLRTVSASAAMASRMGAEIILDFAIPIEHIDARSAATVTNAWLQH